MKHTRVPRTVRWDIQRLAIEKSSIPSPHIFRSRIRNQIASRVEDRKKPNGLNRISNRLTKKKKFHIPGATHVELLLGLIDVVQCLRQPQAFLQNNFDAKIICRTPFQTERVRVAQTLYQHQSTLPYMGCCTLSSCSSTKLGTNDAWTHNPIDQGVDNKKIYTVHDDLKLLRR